MTDQGIITGNAAELLRSRQQLGAETVRILADVDVKHSAPLAHLSLAAEAEDLVERSMADGLIVTGRGTGHAAIAADLRAVSAAAKGSPVFVGSGVTPESAREWLGVAGGMIVGTSLKVGGELGAPVDPARVRRLVAAVQ